MTLATLTIEASIFHNVIVIIYHLSRCKSPVPEWLLYPCTCILQTWSLPAPTALLWYPGTHIPVPLYLYPTDLEPACAYSIALVPKYPYSCTPVPLSHRPRACLRLQHCFGSQVPKFLYLCTSIPQTWSLPAHTAARHLNSNCCVRCTSQRTCLPRQLTRCHSSTPGRGRGRRSASTQVCSSGCKIVT